MRVLAAGTEGHRGDLENLETLRSGAADSDAVIRTAFNHDFSQYVANCESDRQVIEAIGRRSGRLRQTPDWHLRDRNGERKAGHSRHRAGTDPLVRK